MTSYVALLRAVNLGPINQMPKMMLKAVADELGFARARTFLASGNLLFDTDLREIEVKTAVEARLAAQTGKPVAAFIRTAAEIAAIRDASPFASAPSNRVVAVLLDTAPPADALSDARHLNGEQMALGIREIYIRYTDEGMGRSKLVIPGARAGTGRNMNTIAKLTDLLA